MKRIIRELRPFKKPLILIGIILGMLLIFTQVIPTIREMDAKKTPIVSISAKNGRTYERNETIAASDFTIKAKHKSGKTSSVNADEVTLSTTKPQRVGKYTTVEITLNANKKISTTVKVKNRREKIAEFECGNPKKSDVKAVIYSNGELCFEGKGNVLQYEQGEFPWQDSSDDYTITAVSFEKDVMPISMDYWFEGMEELTYIAPLPESVQSIVGMCTGCISLKSAPEWSQCTALLDATEAFYQCTALTKIPALPASLRNTTRMCADCGDLQTAPDMTSATGLQNATEMFSGCKKLTQTSTAPNLETMDGMYQDCINLESMPSIPASVVSMESTFSGATSLSKLQTIPPSVKNVTSCFEGCTKVSGELIVECNPTDYSGFLTDAANATQLNLTGSSRYLEVLANTSENGNILVNGKAPNPDVTSIDNEE